MHPSPDKEEPEKKPPSRDPAEFDPSERKFWESDDDEEAEGGEKPEAATSSKAAKPPPGRRNTRRSRKNTRRSRKKDPREEPPPYPEDSEPGDQLKVSHNELKDPDDLPDHPGDEVDGPEAPDHEPEDRDHELEDLDGELEDQDGELEDQDGELEDQDGELEDQDGELEDLDGELEDQDGELEDQDGELENQDGELEDQDEFEEPSAEARPVASDRSGDQDRPPPDPTGAPETGTRRISGADFVWMGVLGLFLLALGIYALGLFFKNVQPSGSPEDVKFPVKGERVVIGKIETYWRKPGPEDKVSLTAQLIPCAMVKLKSGSGAGRLRFFFENDEGDYVGDPVTLSFSSGAFDSNGEPSIDLHSTDGFEHEGQYAAYLTENFNFWHINVLEGPENDQAGEEFENLTRVRISSKRR